MKFGAWGMYSYSLPLPLPLTGGIAYRLTGRLTGVFPYRLAVSGNSKHSCVCHACISGGCVLFDQVIIGGGVVVLRFEVPLFFGVRGGSRTGLSVARGVRGEIIG